MPRKKSPLKFKYTTRRNGILYVIYPLPGLKHPTWRICREETQEAVDNIIAQIKFERAKELENSAVPESFENFAAFWLKHIVGQVSERTIDNRETIIRVRLLPFLKNLALSEIKPIHFSNLYQKLAEIYQTETIRKTHAVASAMFKEAVNLELIAASPLARVKPPKVEAEEKIKAMNLIEAKGFLAACADSLHGVIFEFALETGMRPEEYLALRWSDLDLEKRTAQVVRAVVFDKRGGGFAFKDTKTRRSRRTVPFSQKLAARLIEHQNRQIEYVETVRERVTKRMKPSLENHRAYNKQILENYEKLNLVFPSQDFTPIKNHNLSRRYFKPILEKAGLSDKFAPYCLRHTCATLLLSANVHPKKVQERLGHASIAITLDTYSHVTPTMQREATDKMSEILY